MQNRVLVIGLDSAPLTLLEAWIAAGELPNLGRLLNQGATGILRSTFPPLSPAAWSSFVTGMKPGKHGVFDHGYRQPGAYRIVPTNGKRRAGTPIWHIIGDRGGQVGVINVPETYPPEPVNGFLITGMSTPSDDSDWCYPPTLKQELQASMGGYKVFGMRSKENLDRSLEGMHQTIPMRMRAAAYLWGKYHPDFMILVFMETDVVQHKTWKYLDPTCPQYDARGKIKYGDAILDVYRRIDESLPLLLDRLDQDTSVIVMSDHGAGPVNNWLNLNVWLLQEKFLRLKQSFQVRAREALFWSGWTPDNAYRVAAKLRLGVVDRTANRLQRDLSSKGTNRVLNLFLSLEDVDWQRTSAYTLGGNMTGIWVNLRGREPAGCVFPGLEYESVRTDIMDRLKELRDPESGQPIVTAVYRREEVYEGPYLERAPDVVFETYDERYVGFGLQEFVTNKTMGASPIFSGCHRRDGMVMFSGSPFRPGIRLEKSEIIDLAPTILYLLGQNIPVDMDGKVVQEAFSPEFLQKNPIQYSEKVWKPAYDDETVFSSDDQEAVKDRLQDLGYL